MQTNADVEGSYSILNPQLGTTRGGKPYLKCLLRDCTGELPARQWTIDQAIVGQLESSGFVYVAGHTQSYNGQVQLIIEQIRPAEVDEADLSRLIPTTTKNIDEMFSGVCAIMRTLEHTKNNKTKAAEILGISLKTLHNKLKEYGASATTAGAAE